MSKLTLRIEFGPHCMLGHGKVRLLEMIAETGSIAAAGRALGMSYRRAWQLVDSLNHGFGTPLVSTQLGGPGGGGAQLSPFGREVIAEFRAMEREAESAIAGRLARLDRAVAPVPSGPLPESGEEEEE
jgi:molybdate transport system regulatory protein